MTTPTKVATKTKWALDDIQKKLRISRNACKALLERNRTRLMDPIVAMELSSLSDALNDADRIARLAQDGQYEQEIFND